MLSLLTVTAIKNGGTLTHASFFIFTAIKVVFEAYYWSSHCVTRNVYQAILVEESYDNLPETFLSLLHEPVRVGAKLLVYTSDTLVVSNANEILSYKCITSSQFKQLFSEITQILTCTPLAELVQDFMGYYVVERCLLQYFCPIGGIVSPMQPLCAQNTWRKYENCRYYFFFRGGGSQQWISASETFATAAYMAPLLQEVKRRDSGYPSTTREWLEWMANKIKEFRELNPEKNEVVISKEKNRKNLYL
jgi:hypothetical protein